MRLPRLAGSLLAASLVLASFRASADQQVAGDPVGDDASIGTRPARSEGREAGIASPGSPASAAPGAWPGDAAASAASDERMVATDPPTDWAVLHAGVRPSLGTFGGIATFALAHARTERFYGLFSLALVRNDAGTHAGLAQLALGRNLADTFAGLAQLSVTENRARGFYGLGQVALAYNRSGSMVGALQLAGFNRARTFAGLAQLGGYNRADEAFAGAVQLGVFNHARGDFSGLAQVGIVSATGASIFGGRDTPEDHRFAGAAQVGLLSSVRGDFYGVAQVGGLGSGTSGAFVGLAQVGGVSAYAGRFRGLVQAGGVAISSDSVGAQAGISAVSLEEHAGVQLGAVLNYAKRIAGAQVGAVNYADQVRGLQVGLVNHARSLRGVQIGLVNHAEDGVLPWTAVLNVGFGDHASDPPFDGAARSARR